MPAARNRREPALGPAPHAASPAVEPAGRPDEAGRAGRRRRPLLGFSVRFLLYWGTIALIWLTVAAALVVVWYARDLPDVSRLQHFAHRPSISFLAADGSLLATFGDLYEDPVALAELPKHLVHAVLATEDRRFHGHFGIDPLGLARAVLINLREGRLVQGGSTITQQLAKNVFLTAERSVKRKVQELLLAFWLERNLSKDAILALYLNRMYFGAGAYGVAAAAGRYFDKPAERLDLAEVAMLAGLLKAPSRLAPTRDLAAAQARAALVLDNMVDAGLLTASAAARAKARPAVPRRAPAPAGARYFADWLMDLVPDFVGPSERDLVVRTTLDARLQKAAEAALAALLEGEGRRHAAGQGAIVVISPDGAVRAMVGGENYAESQFNRAVQARRQPGSAFKPAVYLAGLEAGLGPDTVLVDQPVSIGGYRPRNFNGRFQGAMSLRQALAQSTNTIALQVMERAGRARVIEAARRLGMGGSFAAHPSLALGSGEVTLIDLTAAYATIGNGGETAMPYGLVAIADDAGRPLYRRAGHALGRAVAAPVAATLTGMLESVIAEGTGRAARLDRPVAGKTGTSQEFRDAWFVGFTADYVAGVWLGNDDSTPMREVTGGNLPARLWREVMLAAHAGRPPRPLLPHRTREPEGVLQRLFGTGPAPTAAPAAPATRDFRYLDEKERP
ncbi:MAG: PBP1A family penicillin-binding protein [Alphaproteobacteria bacterium]|nr:PBP1A family penicillin-binding protein [Alphaproteobacteria bacterium]